MAVLTDLPMELLEEIFLNLTSIDDVHYFARVCKSTHKVIQRAKIYTEIMRSVIRQSPALRYDVQLCRLLKMHSDIVEQGEPIQVTTMGPNGQLSTDLNSWERSLGLAIADRSYLIHCCAETLPDEDVYEILARWQVRAQKIMPDADIGLTAAGSSCTPKLVAHEAIEGT